MQLNVLSLSVKNAMLIDNKNQVWLQGADLKAKVFGKVNYNLKSLSDNSVHIQTGDSEKEFLAVVK